MDLESYFISQFYTISSFIGDDGAVVGEYIYSQDAFFEDVHFKKEWMDYEQIARKAMLVNISDAVAMNAEPKYALLSVAMPRSMSKKDAAELARGFVETAKKFDMEIVGGDTISNVKLDISITIVSKSKKPLFRKGIKHGDLLAFSGTLGRSAKELKKAMRGGKLHKKSKFLDIRLRTEFMHKARRYIHAGMDISDGLFSDLEKLSLSNRIGFSFLRPISKEQGCSGEEYELLFSFDPRYKKAIMQRAKQTRTPVTIFAKAGRYRYKNRCKGHHFG